MFLEFVKYEIPSKEVIDDYTGVLDMVNDMAGSMVNCLKADLIALAYSHSAMKNIQLTFELTDSIFKNCFAYFDIFLKKDKKDVSAVKVPFNYDMDMKVSHKFENLPCGSYEIVIQPCYDDENCVPLNIKYPKLLNITGDDCIGLHPVALNKKMQDIYGQGLEKKILLITTVVAITLLIIIGFSYYMLVTRKKNKRNEPFDEDEVEKIQNHVATAKSVEVFIINHYNNTTIRKVELLKNFMSHCPNLNVTLIEDGLAVSLITGSEWLNSMLEKDENNEVIKKLIIVDSVEEMEAEKNENENGTFYEAIRKLSCDWSRSLDDYDNLFVVHFNSSCTKLRELDYIVKRVRYCIPDHLITLCLNLMSGTQCDAYSIEGNLRNLLYTHDIRNLGTYDISKQLHC